MPDLQPPDISLPIELHFTPRLISSFSSLMPTVSFSGHFTLSAEVFFAEIAEYSLDIILPYAIYKMLIFAASCF